MRSCCNAVVCVLSLAVAVSGCVSQVPRHPDLQHSLLPSPVPRAKSRVVVMQPILAARIDYLAQRSPSFRAAWELIHASRIPVRIGTDRQMKRELPRWYRDHPTEWGGLTLLAANTGERITDVVVVIRVPADESIAEIDRVLIHEIFGHLTPAIAAASALVECPDQLRPGEVVPCVQLRERIIAAELTPFPGSSPK